jgi:hypothetical protein
MGEIHFKFTATSLYGRKLADALRRAEPEMTKLCSCPAGQSCFVEVDELPDKRLEVIVVRPGPVAVPPGWTVVSTLFAGAYHKVFEKRTAAKYIEKTLKGIVAAPLEPKEKQIPRVGLKTFLVDSATLRKAEELILGCIACVPAAQVRFSAVLDQLAGPRPIGVHYILEEPASCPKCQRYLTEVTLVALSTPARE